ncbi:MAG: sigma-54-dependent Fis family transcriptional regulator [Ignavibacteria bacterium]|nr:sigma-54-dependent Fis family transcriptional regulator [Ignavibacteria bacterium]
MRKNNKEIIERSHKRSKEYGIEKGRITSKKILTGIELEKKLKKDHDLIEIASAYLDELNDFLKGSGFIIILTDEEGCILKVTGDDNVVAEAEKTSIFKGAYMDEQSIGTNAMGTSLSEDSPVQITAKEHFISAYHKWTCSAAPIHDANGKIIGTINLTGASSLVHPHTLGLVVSAVNAVENKLDFLNTQKELFDSNQFAFAMMNSLSYGVFAIDLNDDIHWVNDMACRSLNIRRMDLINRPFQSIFKNWQPAKNAVLKEQSFTDEEGEFSIPGQSEKYVFTVLPIKNKENDVFGFLLMFREFHKMINIVNKYSGIQARFTFNDVVANSAKMKEVIKYAKKISNSPSTILITGESGTGKEVLAQSIHFASERKNNSFVAINCGALPDSLIESELFGYDPGAFTGAKRSGNPGKFELADKGTLFLDEIGEMPIDMQVRLLRTLQDGAVTRIGGTKDIPVDVRIITATNKNPEEEIAKGRFRMDLFYRLNVIRIHIPPLRERREDIEVLIRYFLKKKSYKLKKPIPELNPELMKSLIEYEWPGNVRELENAVEKIVLLEGNISENDVFFGYKQPETIKNRTVTNIRSVLPLMSLEEMEKNAIVNALSEFSNNISSAAKILGISRNTFYMKMKKYGIPN